MYDSRCRTGGPRRLKRELDAVLALQDQIEDIRGALSAAEASIQGAPAGAKRSAQAKIRILRQLQGDLVLQAEELYTTLDVGEGFPQIRDFGMQFTRTLVLAHDAKRRAQRLLRGRLQEQDKLNRATGGTDNPLSRYFFPCPSQV